MRDSWKQLKSDSTSWQRTLKNSHKPQNQWHVVSTLCQEKNDLIIKIGFEGTPKLGPCQKSQPATCKVNMEWKSELCLWTKTILTPRSEFLMAWTSWSRTWATRSTTTTSKRPLQRRPKNLRWKRMYLLLQADQRLKQYHEDLPLHSHLQELYLLVKELGILNQKIIRPSLTQGQNDSVLFFVMVIYLEKTMERLISGDKKIVFGTTFENSEHWSGEMWKSKMQGGGDIKKRFQYCTDPSGQEFLHLRALQCHSRRNLIDPTLQDNELIPDKFFKYIYHIWCAISLHSIINSGLIPGVQKSGRKRQTVFFTAVNPLDKDHKDPHKLDLTKPRLASYKQKKWKRHQDTVYWVDIQLSQRKGLKLYQTKCNKIIPHDTLPTYCISNAIVMKSE